MAPAARVSRYEDLVWDDSIQQWHVMKDGTSQAQYNSESFAASIWGLREKTEEEVQSEREVKERAAAAVTATAVSAQVPLETPPFVVRVKVEEAAEVGQQRPASVMPPRAAAEENVGEESGAAPAGDGGGEERELRALAGSDEDGRSDGDDAVVERRHLGVRDAYDDDSDSERHMRFESERSRAVPALKPVGGIAIGPSGRSFGAADSQHGRPTAHLQPPAPPNGRGCVRNDGIGAAARGSHEGGSPMSGATPPGRSATTAGRVSIQHQQPQPTSAHHLPGSSHQSQYPQGHPAAVPQQQQPHAQRPPPPGQVGYATLRGHAQQPLPQPNQQEPLQRLAPVRSSPPWPVQPNGVQQTAPPAPGPAPPKPYPSYSAPRFNAPGFPPTTSGAASGSAVAGSAAAAKPGGVSMQRPPPAEVRSVSAPHVQLPLEPPQTLQQPPSKASRQPPAPSWGRAAGAPGAAAAAAAAPGPGQVARQASPAAAGGPGRQPGPSGGFVAGKVSGSAAPGKEREVPAASPPTSSAAGRTAAASGSIPHPNGVATANKAPVQSGHAAAAAGPEAGADRRRVAPAAASGLPAAPCGEEADPWVPQPVPGHQGVAEVHSASHRPRKRKQGSRRSSGYDGIDDVDDEDDDVGPIPWLVDAGVVDGGLTAWGPSGTRGSVAAQNGDRRGEPTAREKKRVTWLAGDVLSCKEFSDSMDGPWSATFPSPPPAKSSLVTGQGCSSVSKSSAIEGGHRGSRTQAGRQSLDAGLRSRQAGSGGQSERLDFEAVKEKSLSKAGLLMKQLRATREGVLKRWKTKCLPEFVAYMTKHGGAQTGGAQAGGAQARPGPVRT